MLQEIIDNFNHLGASGTPFYFLLNYRGDSCYIDRMDRSGETPFFLSIEGRANRPLESLPYDGSPAPLTLIAHPESYDRYAERFAVIREGQLRGDSFLANLTQRTAVDFAGDPRELLSRVRAKYCAWLPGHFLCFSPEIFVRISSDGVISSYPMKGTIDATLPDAEQRILSDPKEQAESATIVDLIRNDLSSVAEHVRVERYRYIDRVETRDGALQQVSSEVTGQLPSGWQGELGTVLS